MTLIELLLLFLNLFGIPMSPDPNDVRLTATASNYRELAATFVEKLKSVQEINNAKSRESATTPFSPTTTRLFSPAEPPSNHNQFDEDSTLMESDEEESRMEKSESELNATDVLTKIKAEERGETDRKADPKQQKPDRTKVPEIGRTTREF